MHELRVDHPIVLKFKDRASLAVKPLSSGASNRSIETVERLEELDDISALVELLSS